jgi:hypothetical protein
VARLDPGTAASRLSPERPAPDRAYLDRLERVSFAPVFIVGDHRSGTTLLYQLLSRTGAFNVLTAYHVIRYGEVLANHLAGRTAAAMSDLADQFAREGLANRIIDGVAVTPDLPEEYGFVVDASSRPQTRPETLPRLIELAQKLRFVGRDAPVLLKNPWDVLRFAYLREAFSNARFVFIHRHPLNVMASQIEATRSLFKSRNGYVSMLSPWYRQLFERPIARRVTAAMSTPTLGIGPRIAAHHVTKVAQYYLEHVPTLPRESYVEIRYEDLCADADATLAKILSFLDLEPVTPYSARDSVRTRPSRVSPPLRKAYRRVAPKLADYCAVQGYEQEP